MIVVDTNVISEVFKPSPNHAVVTWLQRQPEDAIFTTAITRGELLFGVNIMQEGKRKEALLAGLLRIFDLRFPDRVLPYDSAAADCQAMISAMRRIQGRTTSQPDAMIAGIVRSHGAALATRNLRDFDDCGFALIDPWR